MILALDLSTKTGWALGQAGHRPRYGTWHLGYDGASAPARWAALLDAVADVYRLESPTEIHVEAPLPAIRQTSEVNARLLMGLAACVELFAWRRSLSHHEHNAVRVRNRVMGATHPSKAEILAWCRKNGFQPTDDNAGDALILWHYAITLS